MSRGKRGKATTWTRKTNSLPKVWHPYGCQVLRKLYISNGKGGKKYEVLRGKIYKYDHNGGLC